MNIDGEYLSCLRFADDILIYTKTLHELQEMLQELAAESENQGLKMNKSKTKMMMENDTPTHVNNTQIDNVETWDRGTAPETKTKTRRFKEESRPVEQYSPSTVPFSRVTLEHA